MLVESVCALVEAYDDAELESVMAYLRCARSDARVALELLRDITHGRVS